MLTIKFIFVNNIFFKVITYIRHPEEKSLPKGLNFKKFKRKQTTLE